MSVPFYDAKLVIYCSITWYIDEKAINLQHKPGFNHKPIYTMRHKELFRTYVWLIEKIHRQGPLSLEEIGNLWLKTSLSDGQSLARTSFNRHREEIEDLFGIKIVCDRRNGWKYSIENAGNLDRYSAENWMASTISLNNVIVENLSVSDRILLENIPSEGANLQRVIEAMKSSSMIELHYLQYHSTETKLYIIEPYCVKLYHRRWYMLARYHETPNEFRVFSFDRIADTVISSKKFKIDKDFDAASYFNEFFGVAPNFDVPLQNVVVRAYNTEQYYMRDLPVHPTQRLIAEGEGYCDYEVTLRPTEDFLGYLLSRAQWVEVISPQEVRDQITSMADNVRKRYK